MIDDVMTTGQTKVDSVKMLQEKFPKLQFSALLIAFDRQEKDKDGNNAIQQFTEQFNIPVQSIVTISEVKDYLYPQVINEQTKQNIEKYLQQYGS
jgi:orotate phosphoribosyltransferase